MGDWTAAIGILIIMVLWIQIFLDYRRKLVRIMPGVSHVNSRKETISKEITEHQGNVMSIEELTPEQVDMRTLVIIGSSQTCRFAKPDGGDWVYTPRSYPAG